MTIENKINLGYGSVSFLEDSGFNISTEAEALKTTDGVRVETKPDKVQEMYNLGMVKSFLDELLFEPLYVEPYGVSNSSGGDGEEIKTGTFVINNKYLIHMIMVDNSTMLPSLVSDDKQGNPQIIKFEYSGENLEAFFKEIKKDLNRLCK